MTKRKSEPWRFDEDVKISERAASFDAKLPDAAFVRFAYAPQAEPCARQVAARRFANYEVAISQPSADEVRRELSKLAQQIENLALHFERREATGDKALLAIWRVEEQFRRVHGKDGRVAAYPEYSPPGLARLMVCAAKPASLDEVFEDIRTVSSELRGFAALVAIASEFPTHNRYKSRDCASDVGPPAFKTEARQHLTAALMALWEAPQWADCLTRPVLPDDVFQSMYGIRPVSFGHKAAGTSNGKHSEFQAWANGLLAPFKFPPVTDDIIKHVREEERKSTPENG